MQESSRTELGAPLLRPPAGHGVQRRLPSQGRVRLADELQQLAVKVEVAGGDQVDDRDGYLALEEGGTLGNKGAAAVGSGLVRRADNLDRGHELPATLAVVDEPLVFVLSRQVCLHA